MDGAVIVGQANVRERHGAQSIAIIWFGGYTKKASRWTPWSVQRLDESSVLRRRIRQSPCGPNSVWEMGWMDARGHPSHPQPVRSDGTATWADPLARARSKGIRAHSACGYMERGGFPRCAERMRLVISKNVT